MTCELLTVLLVTGTAFTWSKEVAMTTRGYETIGGECLFLLLPVVYYADKRTILDLITYIRKQWMKDKCI